MIVTITRGDPKSLLNAGSNAPGGAGGSGVVVDTVGDLVGLAVLGTEIGPIFPNIRPRVRDTGEKFDLRAQDVSKPGKVLEKVQDFSP